MTYNTYHFFPPNLSTSSSNQTQTLYPPSRATTYKFPPLASSLCTRIKHTHTHTHAETKKGDLPTANPPDHAPNAHRNPQMPRNAPRHGVQKLGAKHRPDKEMLPQQRTSRHDAREHRARPKRQEGYMRHPALSGAPRCPSLLLLPR